MKRRKRSGFTLAEMLMVMIVIMILFAISLPALQPLFAAKGIEASAQQLQAVLLNARALACKYNTVYSVVFNNCPDLGGASSGWQANTLYKPGATIEATDEDESTTEGKQNREQYVWQVYAVYAKSTTYRDGTPDYTGTAGYSNRSGSSPFFSPNEKCPVGTKRNDYRIKWIKTARPTRSGDRETINNWYAVVGFRPGDTANSIFDGCIVYQADETDFHGRQVGPRYRLCDGTAFLALSYRDHEGDLWDAIASNGPSWNGTSNAFFCKTNFRIDYMPNGEARFIMPLGTKFSAGPNPSPNDSFQVIGICKEVSVSSKADYDARLAVVVHKYSGLVEIRKNLE